MTKTVLQKLGYKPGMMAWVAGRPDSLAGIIDLPTGRTDTPQFLLAFVGCVAELAARAAELVPHYQRGGSLWFAYPKKSGSIKTDITRDQGWDALKAYDLLPVTQIAVDADWSALRFRYRDEIAKLTRKF